MTQNQVQMLMAQAEQVLQDVFGYSAFHPSQENVLQTILRGEQVLAVMPTGAGKSLCFQIPALVQGGLTIVVSPLVALMEDQVTALKLAGVAAETMNSSKLSSQNATVWAKLRAHEIRLLYISPERLMMSGTIETLKSMPIKRFAIDEAHCISRWGPSFRPQYLDLVQIKDLFPNVPIAAFTATADETTRKDILTKLFNNKGQCFVAGFDRPNITLAVEIRDNARQQLLNILNAHRNECGIVYCLSRKNTEDVAKFLQKNGVHALAYHAGLPQAQRTESQNSFMTESAVVMVATIAFGMGIDKSDVRFVVHNNLPANMESYYQELGRAGRDGAPAQAYMIYGLNDVVLRRRFIENENSENDHKRREHKRLDALVAYCEAPTCRRRTLLAYFGEELSPCGNCDVCLNPPELEDGSVLAQKLLRTIVDTGQRFGGVHIIDILRGSDNQRIKQFNHQKLRTYGVDRNTDKKMWNAIIRQLVSAGFIKIDISGYGGLNMTADGALLLKGEKSFFYRKDKISEATKASRSKPKAQAILAQDVNVDLLAALKLLRTQIAKQKRLRAYLVFSDKSLIDMAARKPKTPEEFEAVFGVGKAKLEKFGKQFMDVIEPFV
jgi:ATP-dependent DNA helicase RecQ